MLNVYRGRCAAIVVCILIVLSIVSGFSSYGLPNWEGTQADAKFTSSKTGVEETQSISGPKIQDFWINSTTTNTVSQFAFNVSDSVQLWNATLQSNATGIAYNQTISLSGTVAWANFTITLPASVSVLAFQFWICSINSTLLTTTGLRTILCYSFNAGNFLNLASAIQTIDKDNNWGGVDPYLGVVLQKNSSSVLNSMIDNYASAHDWIDVLKWSAFCNKLCITQQADIEYALGNYTMVGNLPFTDSSSGSPDFLVESKWALYGYYYANTTWYAAYSGYDLSQWNITAAYQQFNASVAYCVTKDSGFMPLYMFANGTSTSLSDRFYDECACTIEDYIIFAELLNVSGALDMASYYWTNYEVGTHWSNNYGGYFRYSPYIAEPCFECEASFFLKIAADLKYFIPNMPNWTNVLSDVGNRFLSNEWNSYQWLNSSGLSTYAVTHMYYANQQQRLVNTLGAWQAMFAIFLQLNSTYQSDMKDMLIGNINTKPAWELLIASGLFNSSSDSFSNFDLEPGDQDSTAEGEILMFMMGIVPATSTIAYPIEELNYEYTYDIDPLSFNFNVALHQITIPVVQAGTITFQYGCSPVSYSIKQSGIWQINFASSWNNIASAQKLGNLPSNTIYFQNVVSAPIHDVAVVDVTSSKTVIGQGYSSQIYVRVANQGTFSENFNVTAYANTTAIGTQQADLNVVNQTILTFTWNTSGVAYGNYTLSAYAWPVPNEKNTANNNYIEGTIILTIPGDINGDFKVTRADLVLLASSYGSEPGEFNWNQNADIKGNGVVDLADLVILAIHYGQQYT